MRVYGFDDTGIQRGDLVAAVIDATDLHFGEEAIATEMGWEVCFTRFADAQKSLIEAMEKADVDHELIQLAKSVKASHVPVVNQ